jgi:hypothetical protein
MSTRLTREEYAGPIPSIYLSGEELEACAVTEIFRFARMIEKKNQEENDRLDSSTRKASS